MNIDMQPVESSNVAAVGYHDESQTLAVEFKNGGVYHYSGVPADTHAALMGAESVGKFIATSIRGQFDHAKQEPQE